MTSFQKNVVFITAAVIVVVCVAFGLDFAIQSYGAHAQEQTQALDEQKTAWREYNISALKALSAVGVFSAEEQKRLDRAGNDVEHMRQALIDIHQGRITVWQAQLEDAQNRKQKLQSLLAGYPYAYYGGQAQSAAKSIQKDESEAKEQISEFSAALDQIQNWQPLSFKQYRAQQESRRDRPIEDAANQNTQVKSIWDDRIGNKELIDSIKRAPRSQQDTMRWLAAIKQTDLELLNKDKTTDRFHASWFLCGGGGAFCAEAPTGQVSSYAEEIFSPEFSLDGEGSPLLRSLWRKGYWAVVVHGVDADGRDQWVSKSPSPSGWVSLAEGMQAGQQRMQDIKEVIASKGIVAGLNYAAASAP